jgi:hypothetical protein
VDCAATSLQKQQQLSPLHTQIDWYVSSQHAISSDRSRSSTRPLSRPSAGTPHSNPLGAYLILPGSHSGSSTWRQHSLVLRSSSACLGHQQSLTLVVPGLPSLRGELSVWLPKSSSRLVQSLRFCLMALTQLQGL